MNPSEEATIELIDAVDKGDAKKVAFFLKKKKKLRLNVNVKDPHNYDCPILHVAISNAAQHAKSRYSERSRRARKEDIKIIKLLINYGANVNIKDSGYSALHLAAKHDPSLIQYLIKSPNASINSRDDNGCTPLHYAVEGLPTRSPSSRDPENIRQRISMIKMLLKQPTITINCQNKDKKTPLLIAVDLNDDKVVEILLAAGADPDIKDKNGKSPLDYNYNRVEAAAWMRDGATSSKTIIKAKLLEYGATKNPHRERARKARARKEREKKATKRRAAAK